MNNQANPSTQTEFTIDADEIEIAAIEPEHEGEELDFGATPAIDLSLEAPIEAGAALMKDIHSIPQKMAFKIGEAAEMVGVKQYVLRYWESEFDMLRPRKSATGQRVYSRKDVETAMMIKKLLYQDRFSIEGARSALRQLKSTVKSVVTEEKTTQKLVRSQESVVSGIQDLLEEIRRARGAFLEG
jgi:DNA-binding transcriptional MerR regulator